MKRLDTSLLDDPIVERLEDGMVVHACGVYQRQHA
jgi:hypothetical protein